MDISKSNKGISGREIMSPEFGLYTEDDVKELINEFLADLKEIRGLFNIIKNHKSYNGIIEKWEKKKE